MLELRSISKSFPAVQALDNVSLQCRPGEIHALVGENGAGKSTLLRVITGIIRPDQGDILIDGKSVRFHGRQDSLRRGIALVNQEIQVIPQSSVAENIMLDRLETFARAGTISWRRVSQAAQEMMDRVGLHVPPETIVGGLSAAHKQLVQIAKALSADARILLLDEPTSSLTEHEAATLFALLRKLRESGVTIVYVSHKLEEIYGLCDCVSVLRDGRHVGSSPLADLPRSELVKMMIGREGETESYGLLDVKQDVETLRAVGLCRRGKTNNVSFTLHEGEILGFYGLVGSGRTELARLLIGDDRLDSGDLYIRGRQAHISSPSESLYTYGMGYVSENRKEDGLHLESSVRTNIGITIWERIRNRWTRCISGAAETRIVRDLVESLDIRVAGLDQRTGDLSGGNQQKVSIAKWLAAGCDILIIDEPTAGVDIGAKEHIHRLIWELAAEKRKSVILISSEMREIISLASRILVFRSGEIVHEIPQIHERNLSYDDVSHEIGAHLN